MTTAAWVQAVSTVVLVVVTGIYVGLTSRLSRAAQATARAAERSMFLDVAPIVFPRRTVRRGVVTGSLHNIGGRPAIEIEMELMHGDQTVGRHVETMLLSGEPRKWEVAYDPNQADIPANAPLVVRCTYKAMTGDEFRTLKRYNIGDRHDFEVFFRQGGDWTRLSVVEGLDDRDD